MAQNWHATTRSRACWLKQYSVNGDSFHHVSTHRCDGQVCFFCYVCGLWRLSSYIPLECLDVSYLFLLLLHLLTQNLLKCEIKQTPTHRKCNVISTSCCTYYSWCPTGVSPRSRPFFYLTVCAPSGPSPPPELNYPNYQCYAEDTSVYHEGNKVTFFSPQPSPKHIYMGLEPVTLALLAPTGLTGHEAPK